MIKPNTIFVSIASYRDVSCSTTLNSLFENAEFPKNITVGMCQQNSDIDNDCLLSAISANTRKTSFDYSSNVKVIRIPSYEGKGPTWARYLCSTLWNNEEYYMQIDSHMLFVKNWDTICINMLKKIKTDGLSNKPVISHYPKELDTYTNYKKTIVPRMCKSFFNERGMISFLGAQEMETNNIPYRTPYVAGGMFFCESSFLKELPYDPNLPFLFVGEEILHSIRFFTNGWDVFTPTENILFHEYTRKDKPKIWTDNPYYSDMPAFEKVKVYLKMINKDLPVDIKFNMDKYGLGTVRTLEDYYSFAGIDINKKTVSKDFCNNKDGFSTSDSYYSGGFPDYSNATYFFIFILFLLICVVGYYGSTVGYIFTNYCIWSCHV